MRRVLVPLVLVALVTAACGESNGTSLRAGEATTTSTPAAETAAGATTAAPETTTTSTTTDDGSPSTESTETISSTPTTTTTTGRTPATVPQTTIPPTTGEGPSSLVDQIIADAAERGGVADSEVTVIRSESVVWNDGSLGCPKPGVAYTQALVDGYWIVVVAAGTEYDYRATSRGSFKLCEMPTPGGSGTDR